MSRRIPVAANPWPFTVLFLIMKCTVVKLISIIVPDEAKMLIPSSLYGSVIVPEPGKPNDRKSLLL